MPEPEYAYTPWYERDNYSRTKIDFHDDAEGKTILWIDKPSGWDDTTIYFTDGTWAQLEDAWEPEF